MMAQASMLMFVALVVVAAVFDLLTMTIPNKLNLGLALAFPVVALVAGLPPASFALHILAGCGMLAIGFGLFAAGWIGGGDAKLAAAIGLWFGPSHLLEWSALASVFGGMLTLLLLAGRQLPLPLALAGEPWIAKLHHPKTGVPYGIALSAAALVLYPEVEIFLRLAV
jgi:prepilin peptidase CpaA